MIEYPKIESVFKRNNKTHKFIEGKYTLPEFEYLKNNHWIFTEKIDGTNVRVRWNHETKKLRWGGRTDDSQMATFLTEKLMELLPIEKFLSLYPDVSMCLYGEGYGAKIQKGGGNYIPNGVDFALFDVMIMDWWLRHNSVMDIAKKLEIKVVPFLGTGTLQQAIDMVKEGSPSMIGKHEAEGLVLKPLVELKTRRGDRVITKLKTKDWEK